MGPYTHIKPVLMVAEYSFKKRGRTIILSVAAPQNYTPITLFGGLLGHYKKVLIFSWIFLTNMLKIV